MAEPKFSQNFNPAGAALVSEPVFKRDAGGVEPGQSARTLPVSTAPDTRKFSREELFTPERAYDTLATLNKDNRPISGAVVKAYATAMKAGEWKPILPGIVFDRDGKLHNGYHTLNAVVEAGITIELWVTYNEDPESFDIYDTGKKRNLGDAFILAGGVVPSGVRHSGIVSITRRVMLGIAHNCDANAKSVVGLALQHQELFGEIYKLSRKYVGRRFNSGFPAAFAKAALVYGRDRAIKSLERFVAQAWSQKLGETDPLKRLHLKLQRLEPAAPDYIIYPFAVAAVRADMDGVPVSHLTPASHDFVVKDAAFEAFCGKGRRS